MNISCGIVGLPNAGKSTLFNALIQKQQALAANYPFATIEPNIGIVPVSDPRLETLANIVKTENIIPSTVKFVDIAGIVKGAHQGEGLGNKFLSHIREVELIIHVVRHFKDKDVVMTGSDDPLEDLDTINTELVLADLQSLDHQREPKGNASKEDKALWETIQRVKMGLEKGIPVRDQAGFDIDKEKLKSLFLLTAKPALYVLNIGEDQIKDKEKIQSTWSRKPTIIICAKLESELVDFAPQERIEYLKANHLDQTGLDLLVTGAFKNLGLISFLTAGEKEVRSWTIKNNTKAPQAAATIHSDFEKNFIKAVVVSYDDFVKSNGWVGAKESGLIRTEGKEYIVKSDDVIEFMIGK